MSLEYSPEINTPNKFNKTTISVPTLYFPVHSPLILAQRVNALIHSSTEALMVCFGFLCYDSNYGLIKKVIDGCRVVIDRVHAKLSLDGLPSADDSNRPSFSSNWFGKVDPAQFCGPPLILDVLLQNVEFSQCNGHWKHSGDLKLLRKSQGDRSKDFCVFKTLSARSFDVTLMPHPRRLRAATRSESKKRRKKKKRKKKKKRTINVFPVLLLQNAPLDLRFIFQRKAADGTIKSISIECFWRKLDVFMTQTQYFDLNYWVASLLYAQAQQYAFENPHLLIKDLDNEEPSKSYSTTAVSASSAAQKKERDKESKEDDEGHATAQESKHLSAGKQLFDAMSLCQPPRFQWNVRSLHYPLLSIFHSLSLSLSLSLYFVFLLDGVIVCAEALCLAS